MQKIIFSNNQIFPIIEKNQGEWVEVQEHIDGLNGDGKNKMK